MITMIIISKIPEQVEAAMMMISVFDSFLSSSVVGVSSGFSSGISGSTGTSGSPGSTGSYICTQFPLISE